MIYSIEQNCKVTKLKFSNNKISTKYKIKKIYMFNKKFEKKIVDF